MRVYTAATARGNPTLGWFKVGAICNTSVQFATPPPYGATPPLGGSKSVRLASPPPYGAIPPSSGTMTVNRKSGSQPPPNGVFVPHATQALEGLQPPILEQTGGLLTGAKTDKLRLQDRRRRQALQEYKCPQRCGLPTRDTPPSHLNRSDHSSIATKCAQLGSRCRIRRENSCRSGHNWDAQQKQADHGQKRRYGKQWLEGLTNRPDLLKHLRIWLRKAQRK